MTNVNYTQFSEEKKADAPVVEPVVEEVVEPVVEEVVVEPVIEEVPGTPEVKEEIEEEEPKNVIGVVANCSRLNVRGKAEADAEVLKIINAGVQVKIYEEESTEEFYKVLAGGVVGFCMKDFIEVE